jgi:hypothetical protein
MILLYALLMMQNADQLLDEAKAALRRGDQVAYREKLSAANDAIDRHTAAIGDRLQAHAIWETCVKTAAGRLSASGEAAGDVADAALGSCSAEEASVFVRHTEAHQVGGGTFPTSRIDDDILKWRNALRREVLTIIVNNRPFTGAKAQNQAPQ